MSLRMIQKMSCPMGNAKMFGFDEKESSTGPYEPTQDDLATILNDAAILYEEGKGQATPLIDTAWMNDAMKGMDAIAGGALSMTPEDIMAFADTLWNEDMAQQTINQGQSATNSALSGIDTQAAMTGGTGSSKTGLAQGSAAAGVQSDVTSQLMDQKSQDYKTAVNVLSGNRDTAMDGFLGGIELDRESSEYKYFNEKAEQMGGWDNLNRYLAVVGSIASLGSESESSGYKIGQRKSVI